MVKKFKNRVWLSSPTMHGSELKYIQEAYDTNWMSTIGNNINQLEIISCERVGCRYGVALSSGTAALHMAIKLAGIKQGEKVFCSDMTFAATVNPIVYEGGDPVFIDAEYDTWNMDPDALEYAFTLYPEVKVVVLVHLYGVPAKINQIREICKKYNAILIEDAAESLGATYGGKETGSFGKYNVVSYNGNKIITGSTGGMLLTNDLNAAEKVRFWSTQARENAPWYQHKEIGYNYRMSNVVAGIVRGQYEYLDEHIKGKKEIYERYKEGLKVIPVTMNPYDKKKSCPNFWLSCMLIDQDAMCDSKIDGVTVNVCDEKGKSCPTEILKSLSKINAEGRHIWKPMHLQPLYRENRFVMNPNIGNNISASLRNISVSEDIFSRGLCLPSDNKMTEEEQEIIIEVVKRCFDL